MLKIKNKIYYVAELNLPNKSAYSIHVMKMCEAFSKLDYNVDKFIEYLQDIKDPVSEQNKNERKIVLSVSRSKDDELVNWVNMLLEKIERWKSNHLTGGNTVA